jgi:ribosomal protein L3
MWGTARAAHWHARPGEHRSSGSWGTPGAAQQSFSDVGKNAHFGAKVRGALAFRDVRFLEAWAPQKDAG